MALSSTAFVAFIDKLTAGYLAAVGTSGSGFGLGDRTLSDGAAFGADKKARDLVAAVIATGDADTIEALLKPSRATGKAASAQAWASNGANQFLSALEALCGAAGLVGVTNINSFATYYNTGAGGPSAALLPPDFATIFPLVFPGGTLSPANLYSPPITNIAQKTVGGGVVAGTAINAAYGGAGKPTLVVTGFTGAADTVTVTGANQAGQAGRTWTASVTGNGTVTLVPTVATDLLATVTGITIGALITAGTVVVGAAAPAGRAYPPS